MAAEKNIKGVSDTKDISYDISPSKKSIVMQSKKNQDIIYFDVNKISKDITKKVHTSSKGESYFKRRTSLKKIQITFGQLHLSSLMKIILHTLVNYLG